MTPSLVSSKPLSGPPTNTTALEVEIDQWVYQLYGRTAEEIDIVEGIKG